VGPLCWDGVAEGGGRAVCGDCDGWGAGQGECDHLDPSSWRGECDDRDWGWFWSRVGHTLVTKQKKCLRISSSDLFICKIQF
jgi:hypothetical protein